MKCGNATNAVHKDVVVIGNGPSGIAMSYMLSGNVPYLVSGMHPDEFLSIRLEHSVGKCLAHEDLEFLANGLEGRTTNPVSLLLDSLEHPFADVGLEIESLVEWRKNGKQIDHVVLGKGPPGGSWHSMDPQIRTLSLGSWMALPGVKYESKDCSEKRASAKHVAEYYERYVVATGIASNFRSNVRVVDVAPCLPPCAKPEEPEPPKTRRATISSTIRGLISRTQSKRRRRKSLGYTNRATNCNWIVQAYDTVTGEPLTYTCRHLILANGSSDRPNKLNVSKYKTDPYWLTYNLRSLELELDLYTQTEPCPDPVLVVGAGLSAADAIIATRARNVPVIHLFRNRTADLGKQLPENMYPEYHKVHEMMRCVNEYPYYTPLPGYELVDVDERSNRAIVATTTDDEVVKRLELKVSFAAVLIGSRPDLDFLPSDYDVARRKRSPVDCKSNAVDVDALTHAVRGHDGLYAVGPLAGDNFVRFLPGGALAVLADLYRKYGY